MERTPSPAPPRPTHRRRRPVRRVWQLIVAGSIGYTALHLADLVYYSALTRADGKLAIPSEVAAAFNAEEAAMVAALTAILEEDDVPEADHWARTIVREAPSCEISYIALVTAQIRRESNFHARDLEWLYDRMVPDVAHELGMKDQVQTIGPMQIQRYQLQTMIVDEVEVPVPLHDVKAMARSIDLGVHYAVKYLDNLVLEYVPERDLHSWFHYRGRAEFLAPGLPNHPMIWDLATFAARCRTAALQKMVADLTDQPLVLDGVFGARTAAATRLCGTRLQPDQRMDFTRQVDAMEAGTASPNPEATDGVFDTVSGMWESIYGSGAPPALFPRVAYDERLVFILADFNSGRLSSRVAALQQMLGDLGHPALAVDGKLGPLTRAALAVYIEASELPEPARTDFLELLNSGDKPVWTIRTLTELVGRDWQERFGRDYPKALCPDLAFDNWTQRVKRIGRMTTRDYVVASCRFFEQYDARLRRTLPRVETGRAFDPARADGTPPVAPPAWADSVLPEEGSAR